MSFYDSSSEGTEPTASEKPREGKESPSLGFSRKNERKDF
jgi:hypothetical protein